MASGQEGDASMSKTAIFRDPLKGRNFSFNYDHLNTMMKIAFYEIKPWKLNFWGKELNFSLGALCPLHWRNVQSMSDIATRFHKSLAFDISVYSVNTSVCEQVAWLSEESRV